MKLAPSQLGRLVLDSGALSALCGRAHDARARLRWVTDHLGDVVLPAAVLVECITGNGPRDAEVHRIIEILRDEDAVLVDIDEPTARVAGALRHKARTDDGIDALVAAVAVGDGSDAIVLTSDPDDLRRLLVSHRHVTVRRV
jgi:predicted nucleic acid-binding protein